MTKDFSVNWLSPGQGRAIISQNRALAGKSSGIQQNMSAETATLAIVSSHQAHAP
jgi:hypothetical protein